MNYSIETDGTIVLKKTTREAELLYKAVQSKHITLRKDPASKETCNRLLEIQLQLNDAIIESNKAKMKLMMDNLKAKVERDSYQVFKPQKVGLWQRIINYFDNPFCTHDFEWAHTRCGAKFTIDGMIFSRELYPCEVYGTVETDNGEIMVRWNDRGRCSSKELKDVYCYDLIRRDRKERDAQLITGFAYLLLLFTLTYLLLNL